MYSNTSDRGKVTGSNQLLQQKDKRVAQHKRQRNDSNAAVVGMVAAMAKATIATNVAAVVVNTVQTVSVMDVTAL
jgi:hypothetical protein